MKGIIKAVLFDLDGTLLDTAPDMANAANNVLKDHGLPPLKPEQVQALTSHGARGLLKAGFGNALEGKNIDELRLAFLDHYATSICIDTNLYAGVNELLNGLSEKGIPWGIVTNKPGFLTGMLLPYFPELLQARTIVCADTTPHAKPHPAPLLHGASILAIAPEQCLYVGDIENDIVAAKAASMYSAVAGWGYIGKDDDPCLWEADLIFNKVEEILSLF
ncbi:HAD family hydrolase [Enterovibrio paralichthyis]|uniref:HAD family hydrolase n=1 Tax=Enterovibrio paralichthyis TaxID=2853805 RepID=UPI001C456517|nr:HAD-IA family hydrolase [Enterovibrio paralichthyis]MBV7297660.1 HAD-IA family hydrolase [Enterovibrio paralichthyis]